MSVHLTLSDLAGTELPPLVYAHDHAPALAAPEHLAPVYGGGRKPHFGGRWTSPVTRHTPDGTPSGSAWTDFSRAEMIGDQDYALLTEIFPVPDARVVAIDDLADLRALVAAHPYAIDPLTQGVDWPAVRDAGWDAVYLTAAGKAATAYSTPDLYGWDVETVLWLRPAYTTGRTVPAQN